jgi:hypothetical protein
MRRVARLALIGAIGLGLLAFTAVAVADPDVDQGFGTQGLFAFTPYSGNLAGGHGHDDIPPPTPTQPAAPPGAENMKLLDVKDKDGTTNSDIAFYKNLAFVGNYDGFRVINIKNPHNMKVLSDTTCRANQGDVSVFKGGKKLYMLQSIDRAVDAPDCSAKDTPLVKEDEQGVPKDRARFGYEGLRLFDVTNPKKPKFLSFYRTECGSHTHTLVPDGKNGKIHAYVASYPLGSQITPQVDRAESNALGLTCDAPHSKISVVSIPLDDPKHGKVKKRALSEDTEYYDADGPFRIEQGVPHGTGPAFQSCHDHQAFLKRDIMVASCAGDLQYWSIKKRGNPTSADGEKHTHIQREVRTDDPTTQDDERWESFDFIHNATVSWDGKTVTTTDESGGGVEPRCDGANTKRGFTFFYPLVKPGKKVDGFDELGRFIVPRPQNTEICVSHNGNVLPTKRGNLQVQAFYQAGNTLLDFTHPATPKEAAWSDLEDEVGRSDSWSSYWYNDVLYVNGGLHRGVPLETANRGFEAYAVYDSDGKRIKTRDWKWSNPQTQEAWQAP